MARRYAVGDRVDGLYDGNSDDVWYPGFVTAVHGDGDAFDVLYDDGEAEHGVAAKFLRVHVHGTICVGSRVYGRYAGGDDWYAGKIQEVQDDGTFSIEYDDGEVEASVPVAFIRETLIVVAAGEEEPVDAAPEEAHEQQQEEVEKEEGGAHADGVSESAQVKRSVTPVENANPIGVEADGEEPPPVVQASVAAAGSIDDTNARQLGSSSVEQEDAPVGVTSVASSQAEAAEDASVSDESAQQSHKDRRKSRTKSQPPLDEDAPATVDVSVVVPDDNHSNNGVVDEYADIFSTMERLKNCAGDAVATKTLLSTLVKQMRAFPQATADLVHARGGEGLLMDILKQHHTHAVIQCYGFVLLRRLCFLCGKSTHFFLRNGIVELVTIAMRKFPEDAILQASACGALAVFTRVHTGLAALLENRVSHLVLATIIFHKSYSVHTRQVHYYACEVLLELCELGDTTTIEALCGDGISGPGLSDLSPVSLLLFLLRQALSFEDKKACCAAGTLLMCLASCHRHAAHMVLDLNGLSELSTVMAKFPMETGIQKYAASASKEIAMCSMDQSSPHRRVQHAAHNVLGESNSMEDLYSQRLFQQRRAGGKTIGSSKSSSGKRKAPQSQRGNVSSLNGFPSPAHQQQVGAVAAHAPDGLSFSKFTSPIGKAPHLPPNIRPFGDTNGAPSPSAAAYHHQLQQQQRNQTASSLVILDSYGAMTSDKKRFVKDERTNLLFETYGVDAKSAMNASHSNDHHVRTHGIKRRQLKTHIVSASATGSASDGISWASPVKSVILQDAKPLSSRSDKHAARVSTREARKVRSSGGDVGDSLAADDEQQSSATLRRQQLQATTKTIKKKDSEVKTPRSASFQLKLENTQAAASTTGLASPIVLPPKTNRQGTNSSRSKTTAKSTSNRPAVQTRVTSRDSGMGSNASTESLNSYAAQLFKDEIEASAKPTSEATGARDAAQERERLSFAEKLHKMIDKAKSSLAHTSTVSLASEAPSSPVKASKRPEPVRSAHVKKKQSPAVSVTTSRVAPASLKSKSEIIDVAPTASTSDTTVAKKPPVATPKPASIKKPLVAATSTLAASSKPIAPPKSIKANATPSARPAPASSSTPMQTTGPATSNKPATKPTSTAKPTASAKGSKSSQVVAVVAATVAVVGVAAMVGADTNDDNSASAQSVTPEDAQSSQPLGEEMQGHSAADVEGACVKSSKTPETLVDSATVEPSEAAATTPPAESVLTPHSASEPVNDGSHVPTDEPIALEEAGVTPTDVTTTEAKAMESAVEEAAAVASSAADDLYADEYNDFDDLDNGPQTLDDDGGDGGVEMDQGVSFQALMNLTAQVTEFSVATETIGKAEVLPAESVEASPADVDEPSSANQAEVSPEVSLGSSNAAEEAEPYSAPMSDEQVDQLTEAPPDTPAETSQHDAPLQSEETILEAEADSTIPNVDSEQEPGDAASDVNSQVVDVTKIDTKDSEAVHVEEGTDSHESSDERLEQNNQDAIEGEEPGPMQVQEATRETDEQADQRTPSPAEADRPESRQTDVSYADEDFGEATEDVDVEGNVAVEAATEEHEEEAFDADPPTVAAFTLAEPLIDPADIVRSAQRRGSPDNTDLAQPTKPEPSAATEPLADAHKAEARAESSEDHEDDYGDADFAGGDESMPPDVERFEAQGTESINESADIGDDAAATDAEADTIAPGASTYEQTEDASQSAAVEETTTTADPVEAEEEQESGDARSDARSQPAIESKVVTTEECSPPKSTTETSDSLVTAPADGNDELVRADEPRIRSDQLDAAAVSLSDFSEAERLLTSEPTNERTTTPDVYDDAAFDGDEVEAAEEVNVVETADDDNAEATQLPTTIEDQQPEVMADPVSEPDSHKEVMPDESVIPEVGRQATPDAYASDSQFDDEPTIVNVGDVASHQPDVKTPAAIEAAAVLNGNATDGNVPAAPAPELEATEGAVDLVDHEPVRLPENKSTPAFNNEAASSTEADSAAHDRNSPESDEVEAVGGAERAPDSEAVQTTVPSLTGRDDDGVVSTKPADVTVADESEAQKERAATDMGSVPPSDDLPALGVDADSDSPDGDLQMPPADEEDVGSADEQHDDETTPAGESRPATAAAYDDDGFDGETPRAEQVPSVEIVVNDESILSQAEPAVGEASGPDKDVDEGVTEPVAALEDETSQSPVQNDASRPATADAYADDTEFEDEGAAEHLQIRAEDVSPLVSPGEVVDAVVNAAPTAEADKEQEREQDAEARAESYADDDDEHLMKDVNEMLEIQTDVQALTNAGAPTVNYTHEEEADTMGVPSVEVFPSPGDPSPIAVKEESAASVPQPTTPNDETAYEDDALPGDDGDEAGPPDSPGTLEGRDKDDDEEGSALLSKDADGAEVPAAPTATTEDIQAPDSLPLGQGADEASPEDSSMLDGIPSSEVEGTDHVEPTIPLADKPDGESTALVDSEGQILEDAAIVVDTPEAREASTDESAQNPAVTDTASTREEEGRANLEDLPETPTPVNEQPASEEPVDAASSDDITDEAAISAPNDDALKEDTPVAVKPSAPIEGEPLPDNVDASWAEAASSAETAEESELHQLPVESSEEPVKTEASEHTIEKEVDGSTVPEERLAETARSDREGVNADDDFDYAAGEAAASEPLDKPEERESLVSDEAERSEEAVPSPPGSMSEAAKPIEEIETSAVVTETESSHPVEHQTDMGPTSPSLESPAEQAKELFNDQANSPELPDVDVEYRQEAAGEVAALDAVDSAEEAAHEDSETEAGAPTAGGDVESSEPPSEPHEEEISHVESPASTPAGSDPVPPAGGDVESDTTAIESSQAIADGPHNGEGAPADNVAPEQESSPEKEEVPTTIEEKVQEAAGTQPSDASELESEPLDTAVQENEPTEYKVPVADDMEAGKLEPAVSESITSPMEEAPSEETAASEVPEPLVAPLVALEPVEAEAPATDEVDVALPQPSAESSENAPPLPIDAVEPEEAIEEPTPNTEAAAESVDSSTASEEPPSETREDTSRHVDAVLEAAVYESASGDNSEPPRDYAFEEVTPSPKEQAVEEVEAALAVPVLAPAATEVDEPLYKDDDNEFEEDTPRTVPLSPPSMALEAPMAATPVESVPSPSIEEAEYDDFEADESPTSPRVLPAAVAPKLVKQPTKDEIDDETAYAADDDAYNEFEDDDEPPRTKEIPTLAVPVDDMEDAYDMEETFDEDDKTVAPVPTPHPSASATGPAAAPTGPAAAPTSEEDGDYEAEYDDFED